MARTSEAEMEKLVDIQTSDVTPFIAAANALIDQYVAPTTGLDSDGLARLETWLAVHFLQVREPPTKSESVNGGGGGVSESFALDVGKYFEATIYGQQAMLLDDTGQLKALNKGGGPTTVSLRSIQAYDRDIYN